MLHTDNRSNAYMCVADLSASLVKIVFDNYLPNMKSLLFKMAKTR